MKFMDIFRINKIKNDLENTKKQTEAIFQENSQLKLLLQPEHHEILDLRNVIVKLNSDKKLISDEINSLKHFIGAIQSEIEIKKSQIIMLDEQILLESFSLYEPKYSFKNSDLYKQKLDAIRDQQKQMIRDGTAAIAESANWRVNNSLSEGKKMLNDMSKLLIRSFNNECDIGIDKVKFNNIETSEKRIHTSFENINKLGRITNVSISGQYKNLKLQELYLAYEYQVKKQEEKEEQKQIREQLREEAKLQKEIEEIRKLADKEKKHYLNALEKAQKQLANCSTEEEKVLLQDRITEFASQLTEIEKQLKEVDYREANQRAGYVYIISNIGSFGENVFKIGMTRRLDPYDRVYELGDASVPFNFDVHAMIFSDDAPKLEATLHKAFTDKKLNAINTRREFFNVTIDEIEAVIKENHDKTIEFVKTSDAEEYRESIRLKDEIKSHFLEAAASTQ